MKSILIIVMCLRVLCSDITIGTFRFAGVNEVRVKRSLHSYADTAFIKIPSISKIVQGKRSSSVVQTTANLFNDGDPVTINVGYLDGNAWQKLAPWSAGATPIIAAGTNSPLCTVFQGFVRRRDMNMPLEVECEGYVRQMRLNMAENGFYASTSSSALLKLISAACPDITIQMGPGGNIPFLNITLNEANGADICDKIKELSQGVLSVFFINPTTLWCGLTYTPYMNNTDPFALGLVNYELGYNVVKDNGLKERTTEDQPVQVIINGCYATGQKITTASQTKYQGRKAKSFVNNIGDKPTLQAIANEKQYQMNYAGYEGALNTFLQPYCAPGYKANTIDDRYKVRNGVYMAESTDITYGMKGGKIKVEIGPKIGFIP